jgi:hypothetical protein
MAPRMEVLATGRLCTRRTGREAIQRGSPSKIDEYEGRKLERAMARASGAIQAVDPGFGRRPQLQAMLHCRDPLPGTRWSHRLN